MKAKDIKTYETGEHCFGPILKVNGQDYNDLKKEEVLEFVTEMLTNDLNSDHFLGETFKNALEYLQLDCFESDRSDCEQCGNWNSYAKYE